MIEISNEIYIALASLLKEAIGNTDFFNGSIEYENERFHARLTLTAIVYRRTETTPEGTRRPVSDIVPVWWELSTIAREGRNNCECDYADRNNDCNSDNNSSHNSDHDHNNDNNSNNNRDQNSDPNGDNVGRGTDYDIDCNAGRGAGCRRDDNTPDRPQNDLCHNDFSFSELKPYLIDYE